MVGLRRDWLVEKLRSSLEIDDGRKRPEQYGGIATVPRLPFLVCEVVRRKRPEQYGGIATIHSGCLSRMKRSFVGNALSSQVGLRLYRHRQTDQSAGWPHLSETT